jgi:3-methyl-2-oxobutanoate hydroxymethyltransferase
MQSNSTDSQSPVTVATLRRMKTEREKIACLTVYDASFARVLDDAGVDILLVGDSLGMVIQGQETTLPVTVEHMVYHTRSAARGRRRALLIADMPFMSYATPHQALNNAARLMREGQAQMVKLEGGHTAAETVRALSDRGIPVCSHLGLQPQSVHKVGGYRVQGRGEAAALGMLEDAKVLQEAGADLLVLECVPSALAAGITVAVDIPVIGIGAGPDCDGQVLVLYDMLGVTPGPVPRFAHDFLQQGGDVATAVRAYVKAVRGGSFPTRAHAYD